MKYHAHLWMLYIYIYIYILYSYYKLTVTMHYIPPDPSMHGVIHVIYIL